MGVKYQLIKSLLLGQRSREDVHNPNHENKQTLHKWSILVFLLRQLLLLCPNRSIPFLSLHRRRTLGNIYPRSSLENRVKGDHRVINQILRFYRLGLRRIRIPLHSLERQSEVERLPKSHRIIASHAQLLTFPLHPLLHSHHNNAFRVDLPRICWLKHFPVLPSPVAMWSFQRRLIQCQILGDVPPG